MLVPFHKPILPNDLNSLLKDILDSGWITTGPKVKLFEQKLQQYLNSKYVIALNSGTAALHLALAAKGLTAGDKFIAPTYTFVASVEVGEYLGAQPILVDNKIDTFNLDLDKVEEHLMRDSKNQIKAIIPVHFGGQSVDMERVFDLAKKYNVFVLEDAAHAIETIGGIDKVGNSNYGVAFSFYANKNITTGGEGGAFSTNDPILAEKVRKLSLHGMSRDGWERFKFGSNWMYDVSDLGYKYNMTDIAASFGIEQLYHISDWHIRRLEIVEIYNKNLSTIEGLILPKHVFGKVHAWHLFVIRIIPAMWKISRDQLIKEINISGIGTSVHYVPVHKHSYYQKKYEFNHSDFPIAEELCNTVISLPIFPKLKNDQVNYISLTLLSLWKKFKC